MFAVSKNNPHRGGILTCAHMLPPSSQRKSSQKRDFELGLHASHHLKNNPPKGRIPKRWDKNLVQEILPEGRIINRVLLIEGYLHISTFYSVSSWCFCMKLQFMNMPVALESRSMDVEMDVSKVRELSSTWMLRE